MNTQHIQAGKRGDKDDVLTVPEGFRRRIKAIGSRVILQHLYSANYHAIQSSFAASVRFNEREMPIKKDAFGTRTVEIHPCVK